MADSAQLLICHACGDNWVRDSNHYDSRLLCPSCGSDFVQIIEEDGGPPEREPESERDSLPRPPLNPWADHNPWARDIPSPSPFPHHHHHHQNNGSSAYDPMDFAFPSYSYHTYQSPDGRFSFSGTTMRGSFPPRQTRGGYSNPMIPTMLQTIQTIVDDFVDTHDHAHQHHQHQHQHQHSSTENGNRSPRSDESPRRTSPNPDLAGIDEFAEFEGLFPRDTDRPQRMGQPVFGLGDLLDDLRHRTASGRRTATPRMPMGPDPALMISELLRSMGEGGPSRRFGDAVYSREALEEVIAQLGQEDGPPPASNTAIQSLPKKKINKQMLGSDGKAECAICKDTAELGTEVTTLPCDHWFHFDCIEAWLSRHNTCPNCRRSIDSPASPAEGTSDNQPTAQDNPDQQQQSSGRRRRRSSPFSRSSRSARSSFSRTSANSPTQETNEPSRPRRSSRGEGNHRGGITGWVWSRFGGGSSS